MYRARDTSNHRLIQFAPYTHKIMIQTQYDRPVFWLVLCVSELNKKIVIRPGTDLGLLKGGHPRYFLSIRKYF